MHNSHALVADRVRKPTSSHNRPARWIQTIAANLFTRKFFALKNDRSQPSGGAKRPAARSGRPTADNGHVECFHFVQFSRNGTHIKSFPRSRIVSILRNNEARKTAADSGISLNTN